jgi:hypothetical protein
MEKLIETTLQVTETENPTVEKTKEQIKLLTM